MLPLNFEKMIITIVFLTIIGLSFLFSLACRTEKTEDYLLMAFDLSLMFGMYIWDREEMAIWFVGIAIALIVYAIVLYFRVIRPASSLQDIKRYPKRQVQVIVNSLFIIAPIAIHSKAGIFALLVSYIIADRFFFYQRHGQVY